MRTLKRIWSLITTLVVVVMICLAILLVGVRVVGLTPYAVLSGSMEPTYHVGSLIYVKEVDPAAIEIGTPITFVVNEDLLVATHRVVDVQIFEEKQQEVLDEEGNPVLDEEGNPVLETVPLEEPTYYFQTKGDANEEIDGSLVHYKNVIGTPVFSVPYLGYLSNWLQTPKGTIMGITFALVLIILTFLPDLLAAVDDDPKPKKKKRRRRKKRRKGAAKKRATRPDTDVQP